MPSGRAVGGWSAPEYPRLGAGAGLAHPRGSQRMSEPQGSFTPRSFPLVQTLTQGHSLGHCHHPDPSSIPTGGDVALGPQQMGLSGEKIAFALWLRQQRFISLFISHRRYLQTHSPLWMHKGRQVSPAGPWCAHGQLPTTAATPSPGFGVNKAGCRSSFSGK